MIEYLPLEYIFTSLAQFLESIRAYDFNVGDVVSASTLMTDENCYSSDSTNDLDADFLMVPQATFEDTHKHATYFCGSIKKDVVISSKYHRAFYGAKAQVTLVSKLLVKSVSIY